MSLHLPANRQAEIGVIGACLDGGIQTCVEAFELVQDRAFFHDELKLVYQCVGQLVARGVQPDVIALMDEWKRLGCGITFPIKDISDAQDNSAAFMLGQRAGEVVDCAHRRSAMMAGDALIRGAADMTMPVAELIAKHELEICEARPKTPPVLKSKECIERLQEDLERRFELDGKRSGFASGIEPWDEITDGLQPGELWVIGARPSVGKTTLALNVLESVAITQNIPCLFISLEMSAVALMRRMLSMSARIDASDIRRGLFKEDDFKRMTVFNARVSQSPIYIMDAPGGANIGTLCNSIRAAVRQWKVKVVLLDYLQKIRPDSKGEKRTYEIGDTTSMLVEVIKRENVNMFALAQLNRDKDKQGRAPIISDLADSKAIEADADFVGLLERPVKKEGDERLREDMAHLIIAKQRDGERGTVVMDFDGRHHRFKAHEHPSGTNGSNAGGVSQGVGHSPQADH